MALKKTVSPVQTDTLPSTTLIPNSGMLRRFLARLPKSVIVDLVLIWLDHPLCPIPPLTDEDEEIFMHDDESLDDKKALYESYRNDNAVSRKVLIDRILGNDWVWLGTLKR